MDFIYTLYWIICTHIFDGHITLHKQHTDSHKHTNTQYCPIISVTRIKLNWNWSVTSIYLLQYSKTLKSLQQRNLMLKPNLDYVDNVFVKAYNKSLKEKLESIQWNIFFSLSRAIKKVLEKISTKN